MRVHSYSNGGYGITGVNPAGGVMTMPLRLVLTPTANLEAVTKGYVDDAASSFNASTILGTFNSARLPGWSGEEVSSAGGGVFELSATGVTAGTYSKVTVDSKGRVISGGSLTVSDIPNLSWSKVINRPSTLGGYGITDVVSLNGGVMTGALLLSLAPTDSSHLANKAYVDAVIAGSGSSPFVTGDTIYKSTAVTPSGFLRCNGGVVSKTTYAGLYSILGNTYTPEYVQPGAGQPWRQQYDINSSQNGDITGWSNGTALPLGIGSTQVVVTKSRVYLLGGGYNANYMSAVYTAPINTDGTLGAWTTDASLPGVLANSQAVITKNRVYLLGGTTTGGSSSVVYTAPINADGTLGTWVTSTSLPGTSGISQAVVTKSRVYLLGGIFNGGMSSVTQTAAINADGTLGTWSSGVSLPGPLGYSQAVVTKTRVYLLGGHNGSVIVPTVYTALINTDGTITAWTAATSLPDSISSAQSVVTKNKIYLFGGLLSSGSVTSYTYSAAINADGTLGTWSSAYGLPGVLSGGNAIVTGSMVYLIAGSTVTGDGYTVPAVFKAPISGGLNDYSPYYDGTYTPPGSLVDANYVMPGSGQPWRQQYDINTEQSGDITGWSEANFLPGGPTFDRQAIVTKNRVYLLGGNTYGTGSTPTVSIAAINPDGTLSGWEGGPNLPEAIIESTVITTKNRVYLLGGNINGSNSAAVYTAPINSDGTLGTWTSGPSLPYTTNWGQSIVTKNRVYLLGGYSGGQPSVYTALINTDGTLGTWAAGTPLPEPLWKSQAVVTKNRVYLLGGDSSYGTSSTVYTATINTDGTLGVWVTSTPLAAAVSYSQAVVTRNKVYLLGGALNSTTSSSAIQSAVVNSDGTLGTWTVTYGALPAPLARSQAVVTKNSVYLIGGNYNGTPIAAVYTAPISGGLNDYSSYYDGTIQPATLTYTSTDNFNLPDLTTKDKPGSYSYIKY